MKILEKPMKKITKYYLEIRIAHLRAATFVSLACFLLFPGFHKIESTGNNMYTVFLNGEEAGLVDSEETADEYLRQARTDLAREAGYPNKFHMLKGTIHCVGVNKRDMKQLNGAILDSLPNGSILLSNFLMNDTIPESYREIAERIYVKQ